MDHARRQSYRYRPHGLKVFLDNETTARNVVDISVHAVRVEDLPLGSAQTSIRVRFEDEMGNEHLATIQTRTRPQGSPQKPGDDVRYLRFNGELGRESLHELLRLSKKEDHEFELAKQDRHFLYQDISHIQNCRSNIFISALVMTAGIFGGIGMIICRLAVDDSTAITKQAYFWLIIGAGAAWAVLCVTISATIEKARALNSRRGYLAALDEYLLHGKAPPMYRGWPSMQYVPHQCEALKDCQKCALMSEEAQAMPENGGAGPGAKRTSLPQFKDCWVRGANSPNADRYNKHKPPVGAIYASFTSYSAFVYTALMAISIIIISLSFIPYCSSRGISFGSYLFFVGFGIALGLFVALMFKKGNSTYYDLKELLQAKRSGRGGDLFKRIGFCIITTVVVVFIVTLFFQKASSVYDLSFGMDAPKVAQAAASSTAPINALPAFICGLILFLTMIMLGFSILHFLMEYEQTLCGKSSFEAHKEGWRHALLNCKVNEPLS